MTDPANLLKIGSFATLANTNLRTLRYYEEIGLLQPALRSDGGFRYYRPTDVNRVRMIQNLQNLGLQLEDIRELMDTRQDDPNARSAKVLSALHEQERLIARQIADLEEQRGKVAGALAKLKECGVCSRRPNAANNFCEPCEHTGQDLPEFLSALF